MEKLSSYTNEESFFNIHNFLAHLNLDEGI